MVSSRSMQSVRRTMSELRDQVHSPSISPCLLAQAHWQPNCHNPGHLQADDKCRLHLDLHCEVAGQEILHGLRVPCRNAPQP